MPRPPLLNTRPSLLLSNLKTTPLEIRLGFRRVISFGNVMVSIGQNTGNALRDKLLETKVD